MSDEAAFLEAIARNPDDRTARLVFADWLQERDDPRAAWVRDDDVWEWMKPDANDPCEPLAQAVKKGDAKARNVLPRLGGHAIPAVLGALRRAGRGQAFRLRGALDEIGNGAAVVLPFLLKAVDDPKPAVRDAAIGCLSHLVATNAPARDRVIAALGHKDKDVWYAAAGALAEVGPAGAPAVPHLIRLLKREDAAWPVSHALKSIGPPAAEPAIPELMRLFRAGHDEVAHWFEVRSALSALGTAAVGPLLEAAEGSSGRAFSDVVDALSEMNAAAVPEIRKFAKHKDAAVRQAVKEALARLSPAAGTDLLRSPDPKVVGRTLQHLWLHDGEAAPAVPALVEVLANPDQSAEHRYSAARILSRVGAAAEPAVPTFLAVMPTADLSLAGMVSVALDNLGRAPTATLLWFRRKPENRRAAESEASRLRNISGAERPLVGRQELAKIASRVRRPPALVAAAEAAFGPNPAAAVASLKQALADENADVRLISVVGLWHVGTPEAAAALVPVLKDASACCRAQAAEALGHIGAGVAGVEKALEAAARAGGGVVREAARAALERLAPGE